MSIVSAFHREYGLAAPTGVDLNPPPELVRLRMRLIREEFEETMEELRHLCGPQTADNRVACYRRLLKELADLRYVTEGAAVSFGLPIDAAFIEVHRSNMSKRGGGTRADGKILKGPNYFEADMAQFIPDIPEAICTT